MTALDVPLRRAFWKHMIARHPDEADYLPLRDDFARWHHITEDFQLTLSIGPKSIAVFIRAYNGGAASDVERILLPQQYELEAQFGVAMHDAAKDDGFFTHRRVIDMTDRASWNRAADFLWYTSQLYEKTIEDLLGRKG
jgi:hypothetical protein